MKCTATRIRLVSMTFLLLVGAALATPALAFAETPDVTGDFYAAVEQPLPLIVLDGSLDRGAGDYRDVYKVWLDQGREFDMALASGTSGTDFDLYLFDSADPDSDAVAYSAKDGTSDETIHYRVKTAGYYYVDVWAYDGQSDGYPNVSGPGDYTLSAGTHAIKYKLTKFTAPRTAKKNKKVSVSVVLAPGYLGSKLYPVTVHSRQWRNGKWVGKALTYSPTGYTVTGGTKYSVKWWANKGTWKL